MKKLVFAAALSSLALSLSAPARAGDDKASEEFARPGHHEFSADDFAAFTDARIAAMKVGLKLTPAQEKNWPALETALREMGAARSAQMAERRARMKDGQHPDALEMLRRRSTMLTTRAAELNKLADAAKPLFDSLDEAQKLRFGVLLREASGSPRFYHHFGGRHRGGD